MFLVTIQNLVVRLYCGRQHTPKTKNMRNLVGTQLELSPLLGSGHSAGRYCAGYQSRPEVNIANYNNLSGEKICPSVQQWHHGYGNTN